MEYKILIVDDTQFMRKLLADCLDQNGFEVAGEADNGREAIRKYEELRPDLVLMDINMPEMSGIEAIKEILRLDPAAVILVCTAANQQESIAEALELGAKGYIVKPFKPNRVLEIIRKYAEPYVPRKDNESDELVSAALESVDESEPMDSIAFGMDIPQRRSAGLKGFVSSIMCNWQEEINGEKKVFTVICTESENKVFVEMTDDSQVKHTIQFTVDGLRQLSGWLDDHIDRKRIV